MASLLSRIRRFDIRAFFNRWTNTVLSHFSIQWLPWISTRTPLSVAYPLDGRDLRHVPRSEIISAAQVAPLIYQGGDVIIARVSRSAVLKYG
jgi:hypothetical protein